jgi:hypothetical protein
MSPKNSNLPYPIETVFDVRRSAVPAYVTTNVAIAARASYAVLVLLHSQLSGFIIKSITVVLRLT